MDYFSLLWRRSWQESWSFACEGIAVKPILLGIMGLSITAAFTLRFLGWATMLEAVELSGIGFLASVVMLIGTCDLTPESRTD
jgi:hypothetical protein